MGFLSNIFSKDYTEVIEKALSINDRIDNLQSEILILGEERKNAENSFNIKTSRLSVELKKGGDENLSFLQNRLKERHESNISEIKSSILKKTTEYHFLKGELDEILKNKKVNDLFKSETEKYQIGSSYELIKEAFISGIIDRPTFKDARKKAEKKLKNQVHYADMLVFNKKGELLLLQRSSTDDMFPSQWCLPGGHVDPNEEGIKASQRELEEETLITLTDEVITKKHELKNDKAFIEYFDVLLKDTPTVVLNSREHQNYEWVSIDKINDYDLILDLKSTLDDVFKQSDINSPEPIKKALDTVILGLNEGIIKYEDIEKAHKYISRTGTPGNYTYKYREEVGRKKSIIDDQNFDYKDEKFPSEILDNELKLGGKLFREYAFPKGVESGKIYGDKTIEKFCDKNSLDYERVKEFTQTSEGKRYFWSGVYSKYNIDDIQFFIENSSDIEYWRNYLNELPNLNWNGYIPSPKTLQTIVGNSEQNKTDYEHIRKTADEIIRGTKHIERLSPEEEQGRNQGGRVNVEATLLLRGKEITSSEDGEGVAELITAQEKILEGYAKDNGLWVENSTIEKDWKFIDNGEEAKVYDDGDYVKKVYDYRMMSLSPLEFIDNRISLHNFMFPGTSYELTGFTKTKKGLSFILKQPYIRNYSKTPIENIKEEMEKRGFKKIDNKSYYNDNYLVEDLHSKNVLTKDDTGKLYFIDTVVSLNEIGEGYGGIREYKNINVVDDKIEKAFQTIKLGYEEGLISQETFVKALKVYADNAENRKLNRVGQKWGLDGEEKPAEKRTKKEDDSLDKELPNKPIEEYAKQTSDQALEQASKEGAEELRIAAKKELERREDEYKSEEKKEEGSGPETEESFDTKESTKEDLSIEDLDIKIKEIESKIKEIESKIKELRNQ
jgi:8-oxo-dGTP pyrophosphatase MutT (NUDIX family)